MAVKYEVINKNEESIECRILKIAYFDVMLCLLSSVYGWTYFDNYLKEY